MDNGESLWTVEQGSDPITAQCEFTETQNARAGRGLRTQKVTVGVGEGKDRTLEQRIPVGTGRALRAPLSFALLNGLYPGHITSSQQGKDSNSDPLTSKPKLFPQYFRASHYQKI